MSLSVMLHCLGSKKCWMQEREMGGKQEHKQADQTDERLEGVSSPFQLMAERYIECMRIQIDLQN